MEASRGKLQESAMEREKRQLEEKEAYRGPEISFWGVRGCAGSPKIFNFGVRYVRGWP